VHPGLRPVELAVVIPTLNERDNIAALVDRLVPPGYASTYGYHDPMFPVTGRVPRQVVPRDADPPRVRADQRRQDAHHRRLAGAVRAQQGEDRALLDRQVEAVQHELVAETPAQSAHRDRAAHGASLVRPTWPERNAPPASCRLHHGVLRSVTSIDRLQLTPSGLASCRAIWVVPPSANVTVQRVRSPSHRSSSPSISSRDRCTLPKLS